MSIIYFDMVLGAGIISAVILSKKRPGYKTRLQKLEQKLSKKPQAAITLYRIPTKRIITMFIISFLIFLSFLFEKHFLLDLIGYHGLKEGQFGPQNSLQAEEMEVMYKKVCWVLWWIKLGYLVMLLCLLLDLKWDIVRVFEGLVVIGEYGVTKSQKRMEIKCDKQNFKVQIFSEGDEKFTHNTVVYAVKMIDMRDGRSWRLIQRAHVFHARKSAIQICSVLKLKVDKKIY